MRPILKNTSAWLPIAMSSAALALLLGYLAVFGVAREPQTDEGTAAHLFQLLMGGQVPIVAFFVIRWLPQKPKEVIKVIAIQLTAALIPFALLFWLEL